MQSHAPSACPAPASELLLHIPQPRRAEDRLMLAVLLDAVALLREHATGVCPHGARLVADTVRWFGDPDRGGAGREHSPLSFAHACRTLGLDADAFRNSVRRELAGLGAGELFDPPRARVLPWRRAEPAIAPPGAANRRRWSSGRRS